MTDRPPSSDDDAERRHHALVSLHALAGSFGDNDPGLLPGFRPSAPGEALRTVAQAPEEEIPISARLAVLHDLARADFPHYESNEGDYRALAESVAQHGDLEPDQLLDDLKASARDAVPFRSSDSARRLPHHTAAFIGEDVCTATEVGVGDFTATWIFSEFETDAPFDNVVGWIDPRNWPERGPMMFKRMDLVGMRTPAQISTLGDEHWHGVFHEEVQLVTRVNTLLHCDFWRDGARAAGMTYELDFSLDGELDVDRGFLSVNDLGPVRRVKALKIVGFTEGIWDRVALMVCPFWTDWVREAVRGGTTSTPKPTPGSGTGGIGPGKGPGGTPGAETLQAWLEFFNDSASSYLDLFADVVSRARAGGYGASDLADDGTRYWSRLAQDWARAWTYGLETLDELAREGLDASFMPPGAPRKADRGPVSAMVTGVGAGRAEATIVPVAGLGATDQPVCSDLVSIEAGGLTIPAGNLTLTVEPLEGGAHGVRVGTTDPTAPPGLYVGELSDPSGRRLAAVQLYISRATGEHVP